MRVIQETDNGSDCRVAVKVIVHTCIQGALEEVREEEPRTMTMASGFGFLMYGIIALCSHD